VADLNSLSALPRGFYDRDPRRVARDLLGKVLLRTGSNHLLAGRIVETEAYLGTNDPAAHAAAGPTARNRVLFGPPGHAYVYFIYGNHYCLNVSCLPDGQAGCVLIRALEPLAGIEQMRIARGLPVRTRPEGVSLRLLTTGPGRLAQALSITRGRDNGKDVTSEGLPHASDLQIADDGFRPRRMIRTPRVGIRKAAEAPLRYVIAGNPYVSYPRAD
jgi:DNA-3-methyladenine glycosylase